MSSTDKTGDKLVASIRKTKQGAEQAKPAAATKPAPAARPKTAATAKTRTTAAAKPRSRSAPKPKPATPATGESTADSYQAVRRVWPD